MPERSYQDPSGSASQWDNRDALSDGVPPKEPLPAYDNVSIAPPDYASQRAPTIDESTLEMRWTRPQAERGRTRRFQNNLHPEEIASSNLIGSYAATMNQQLQPDPIAEEQSEPGFSRAAFLELCLRILSWSAAAAALSLAVYVSVNVEPMRQVAGVGQLAALIPLMFDSYKIFNLTAVNAMTKASSGRLWYINLIMSALSGVTCSFFWRFGVRDGVFEPFGRTSTVTIAIAFMATSGAFRFIWFVLALMAGVFECCGS